MQKTNRLEQLEEFTVKSTNHVYIRAIQRIAFMNSIKRDIFAIVILDCLVILDSIQKKIKIPVERYYFGDVAGCKTRKTELQLWLSTLCDEGNVR